MHIIKKSEDSLNYQINLMYVKILFIRCYSNNDINEKKSLSSIQLIPMHKNK